MTEDSKDCLQCRLASGGGLVAAGTYVVYHGKKIKTSSRHIITAIGSGLGALGILRMLALPPFRTRKDADRKDTLDKPEENEYIIGKFPPKLQ